MAKPPHSLADHAMGALAAHDHGDGEFDHDHDSDFYLDPASRSLESVDFISVGVDIGSSSTQIAFSRVKMRGPGEHRALRGRARARETLYLSPVAPTPFTPEGAIHETRLRGIVDAAFSGAKLTPDDIETGVVILTGEAATKTNARAIAHVVGDEIGDLVCAAAGHHMEAMLAAHGSGAVEASRRGAGSTILVVDIGGATTKLAVVADGNVMATAALTIGGRVLVIDRDNRVVRLDETARLFARRAGLDWRLGDVIDPRDRGVVAEKMADALLDALSAAPSPDTRALYLTAPIVLPERIDGVMISGGVGEYVYARETRDFGDLGRALGRALRAGVEAGAWRFALLPPGECIRATVLGASEHAMQLSGETIFISAHAALLPVRNLPVLRPPLDLAGKIDPIAVAQAIAAHRVAFDQNGPGAPLALSLPWRGAPEYQRLRALAEGIARGLADRIDARQPLYLLAEGDIALTLGAIMRGDMGVGTEILVIDGVVTRDFDFVDIGRLRMPSHTVPVTIKSLLFGATTGSPG